MTWTTPLDQLGRFLMEALARPPSDTTTLFFFSSSTLGWWSVPLVKQLFLNACMLYILNVLDLKEVY